MTSTSLSSAAAHASKVCACRIHIRGSISCSCWYNSWGGNPLGGLRRFRSPQIMGGNVTEIIPDKALYVIAPFDARPVVPRVVLGETRLHQNGMHMWVHSLSHK